MTRHELSRPSIEKIAYICERQNSGAFAPEGEP